MIHIIAGDKGKGKTKALIDKVNNEVKVVSGTVVFLDNNNKHLYAAQQQSQDDQLYKLWN